MGQCIEDNGTTESRERVLGFRNGKMELNMLASGLMTRQMVMENLFTQMETAMKDFGWMIWLMEEADTLMLMALSMMETGFKMNRMVSVLRLGLMELDMKARS